MFHPVKNSVGLVVLYSIVIIGIFTLQFRNESVLLKRFGDMSVSLAQTQDAEGAVSLKNQLLVTFPGIEFLADEVHPARAVMEDGTERTLSLESCDGEGSAVSFAFTDGTALEFSSDGRALSVRGSLPEGTRSLTMNFKPSSGFSVTERAAARQIFSAKESTFMLTAQSLGEESITLTAQHPGATFAPYEQEAEFSFAQVDAASPAAKAYDGAIKSLRARIVEETAAAMKSPSKLSEAEVAAYVAEMAAQGKYSEAVAKVPKSWAEGGRRTYFTAPYFGAMAKMLPSLQLKVANLRSMLENAAAATAGEDNPQLNVFTQVSLAEFLNVLGPDAAVGKVLALPAAAASSGDFSPTLAQATGILRTWARLRELRAEALAEPLEPALRPCAAAIESLCTLSDDGTLSLSDGDDEATALAEVEAGAALVAYGSAAGAADAEAAGRALVSSALSRPLDLAQAADAYVAAVRNKFYPHAQLLYREKGIWAWVGAEEIAYTERNSTGQIRLSAKTGDISCTIISGIQSFSAISIYGMNYRSDPQFEKYASSGYVYRPEEWTLLLKTRHKSDTEQVALTFGAKPKEEYGIDKFLSTLKKSR